MHFTASITAHEAHTILTLDGELDLATRPILRAAVGQALDSARPAIIIDLDGVTFMDSSGLEELIEGYRTVTHRGVTFTLATPTPQINKVLRATGLRDQFPVCDTVATAIALT